MPTLMLKIAPLQNPERYQALAAALTRLTADILGKRPEVTAVVIDDLEAEFFNADQMGLLNKFVSERGGALCEDGEWRDHVIATGGGPGRTRSRARATCCAWFSTTACNASDWAARRACAMAAVVTLAARPRRVAASW